MSTRCARLALCMIAVIALPTCATRSGGEGSDLDAEPAASSAAEARVARFFERWEAASVPIADEERGRLPALQRVVYEVFEAAFTPGDLGRFGSYSSDLGDARYVVVPSSVEYRVVAPTAPDGELKDTLEYGAILEFRPAVGSADRKALYLDREHEREVRRFLDEDDGLDAVRRRILLTGNFSGGWDLLTPPGLFRVDLDQTSSEAWVGWWIGSESGETRLRKTDGAWEVVGSRVVAVQ